MNKHTAFTVVELWAREETARAWDEGWNSGVDHEVTGDTPNPYRTATTDSTPTPDGSPAVGLAAAIAAVAEQMEIRNRIELQRLTIASPLTRAETELLATRVGLSD